MGQTSLDGYTELLSPNPPRKITYLETGRSPYDQYRLIPQYAPSLRLSLDIIRDGDAQYRTMKVLLALVPDLSELAIHFSSAGQRFMMKDETSRN